MTIGTSKTALGAIYISLLATVSTLALSLASGAANAQAAISTTDGFGASGGTATANPGPSEETAVGTGSTANGIGTTAVGGAAVATGDYSTAVGYSAGTGGSPSNTYNTAVGFAAGEGVTGSFNNASGLTAGVM